MKKSKLKIITKILAILIISLISFVGIYVQKINRMENIVKDYKLSKDLEGYRQIILEVSDAKKVLDSDGHVIGNTNDYDDSTIETQKYKKSEESVNSQEQLTSENYELTKSIIEKRLKDLGVKDYNIGLDKQTGKIYLQIPENDETDSIVSNITESGTIELKDSEDKTVYITNQNLKKARTLYNTTESGTIVYLEIEFNKEGTSILKDLTSNEYAKKETESTDTNTTTNETSEDTKTNETSDKESEEKKEDTQKEIALAISGTDVTTTSFETPIEDGKIDLSMNKASTDSETISDHLKSAATIATILNSGALPLEYTVEENQYVSTDISSDLIRNAIIVVAVVIVILLIYMIIKNKLRGILSAISFIGFTAIYLLLIRYTNVAIALEGIVAISLILLLNYLFSMKLLTVKSEDKKKYKEEYLQFIVKIIPILIISIVFSFTGWAVLNSFGMTMFWGILLMLVYNILVTKNIVD